MSSPVTDALELAELVVRVQGTRFIRELLRSLKRDGRPVLIGVRKKEVLANVRDAIEGGWLSLDELQGWLLEVEGWGKQHAYLFQPSAAAFEASHFGSLEAFSATLGAAGDEADGENLLFPESLTFEPIIHQGGAFELSWKKGEHRWARDSEQDYEEEVEGDLYQFKAWRHEPRRSLQRLVIVPAKRVMALFVQLPLGEEHDRAREVALDTSERIIPATRRNPLSVSAAIRAVDQADLDGTGATLAEERGEIQARDTRFRARGATISFSADPDLFSYADIEPVRHVRRALRPDDFSGESSKLVVHLDSGAGMRRQVMVSMDGRDDRIYFHAQMTRAEVWAVVLALLNAAT